MSNVDGVVRPVRASAASADPITAGEQWPAVSVVVPTRERPALVTQAVRHILAQDYPGDVECIVVFDQSDPHPIGVDDLLTESRLLRTMRNTAHTPGLAGARNTGIEAATGEVVGHCDDDDLWHADKLTRQIELWRRHPEAVVVASGLTVRTDDGDHHRNAPELATFSDFLDSRIMEIAPTNWLVRRHDLVERIGLVDERLPNSFGEDYEWVLRATRLGPVVSVPEPLVVIAWNRPSFYMSKWQAMIDGLTYILDTVPEFEQSRRGLARIRGQIAFAYAAMGRRREAARWALRTLRLGPGAFGAQLRALGALAVAARLADAGWLVRFVQSRGRGL